MNNVYCKNQTGVNEGVIYAFEGSCDSIKINNFIFEDIYRLCVFENKEGGNPVTHRGIGEVALSNGTVRGEFKGSQATYGSIKKFSLNNVIFDNIDGNLNTNAICAAFYSEINEINLDNLTLNLNGTHSRTADIFRFVGTKIKNVYINNLKVNRVDTTSRENLIYVSGITTETDSNLKIYLSNIYLNNFGSGGLYYNSKNFNYIVNKTNCFKDGTLLS